MHKEYRAVEVQPSFEEKRDALFAEIRALSGIDQQVAFHRVLEHSIEDGLRLGELLRLMPNVYRKATLSPAFLMKHRALFNKLHQFSNDGRADLEEYEYYYDQEEIYACINPDGSLTDWGRNRFRSDQRALKSIPVSRAVDDLYASVLFERRISKLKGSENDSPTHSRGVLMAERYLQDVEEVLERRYYTGPMKKIVGFLSDHPALEAPTITETDVREFCEAYLLNTDDVIKRLEPARVVAYRQLDSLKRQAVKSELLKELHKDIPTSSKIELDEATGRYQVVEHNGSQRERFDEIEQSGLSMMEDLLTNGAAPSSIASSLAGVDSERAWNLREKILQKGGYLDSLVQGLAGLDSDRAWQLRDRALREGVSSNIIVRGLTGVDSERAWKLREKFLITEANRGMDAAVLKSLAGLDSERAWEMRERFLMAGSSINGVAQSLAGLDSERTWEMRRRLLKAGVIVSYMIQSLISLDSHRAWQMRWDFVSSEANKGLLAKTLVGLDSDEAWELRERLLWGDTSSMTETAVIQGLAGLNTSRAWEMRRSFLRSNMGNAVKMGQVAESIFGNCQTFVWRLQSRFSEVSTRHVVVSQGIQSKLDLLNLVHHPELSQIQTYWQDHEPSTATTDLQRLEREHMERNPFAAEVFSKMTNDPATARVLLETNPAIPDRAPERLARELIRRMFPQRTEPVSVFKRVTSLFGGEESPDPVSALVDNASCTSVGAGSENLKDHRPVLESREKIDALLTTGIYGKYNKTTRRWEKVFFPVRNDIRGPMRPNTLTLPNVKPGTRVVLPLPLNGRLIHERVKGITAKGVEIPFEATTNSLGEASADIPSGVIRLRYSIEQPLAVEPLHDPEAREFEKFVKNFTRDFGNALTAPLARVSPRIEARLREPSFMKLSPKQKIQAIEVLVRELGWYDEHNEETHQEKKDVSPEEQIVICEERMEQVRRSKSDASMEGKQFAGVCVDFALITCAALRFAGIPAGIMRSLSMKGTEAQMRDSHRTAFVPWPDGSGGARLVAIDGTPQGTTALTADVGRLSLAEQEKQFAEVLSEELVDAQSIVSEALRAAHADDEEALMTLQNGRLEKALNLILHNEVKASHLKAIQDMLDIYWYGGLEKIEGSTADIVLRRTFEEVISSQRSTHNEPLADKDAGTRLLEGIRVFIGKFRKGRHTDRAQAFKVLQHVADLASGELTSVERRALMASIAYLKAKRMQ